jgi:protein-S-isoprenylcysteine O-methyltransferase Ste14
MKRFLISSGAMFFRYRNSLFPILFILGVIISRPAFFLGNQDLDQIWTALGAIIALFGQLFRLMVIGYAYIKRGGKGGKVYADDLVIRGFYAHTRNPMYFGNLLITLGLCMSYGSFFAYAVVLPLLTFAYISIILTEEDYLRKKFGKTYEDYTKNVNRLIPNFHGLKESLSEFKYDWKKALRKDYGNVFVTVFFIIVSSTWKNYYVLGPAALRLGFIAILCLATFYFIIRFLKLSRRLA